MDDNFDQTLKKLEVKVTEFTDHKSSSYKSSINGLGNKINVKALVIYASPFILVAIALYMCKPDFVSYEAEDDKGQYTKKVAFKKVIISTLIIGVVIDVLLFLYLRKKEIKL